MTKTPPPLLRAPRFPWDDARRARISAPAAAGEPVDEARLALLLEAIRSARVGGAFWAPPMVTGDRAVVLRPPTPADLPFYIAAGAAFDGPRIAVLPATDWRPDVKNALHEAGYGIVLGEHDPWSVLRPGARLLADPEDEWRLIGAIAGAEIVGGAPSRGDLAAALLGHVAYRDCFSGAPCSAERAVEILAEWRRIAEANRPIRVAAGISWWKREAIARLLWRGDPAPLSFADDAAAAIAAADGGAIAVWPSRAPEGLAARAGKADVPLVGIEDGFIRSIGLGAAFHPPCSIVVDRGGIYYDPTRTSDLETILETADFPPPLLARAELITAEIVARGISKYASDAPTAAPPPRARRTVLVAGQVEDDKSVLLGGGGVAGNLDLLRRARAAEPDAHLLFKPHPDVDAGHRRGRVPDAALLAFADEIVRGETMASLLARIDAVHVLTSLTGFEALLRGREVTTHGRPFFAGWGLTRDLAGSIPRRTRRLTLPQLVAGALILYPRYLDPVTGLPCPPETLLARFAGGWKPRRTLLLGLRALQGRIARLIGTTTD